MSTVLARPATLKAGDIEPIRIAGRASHLTAEIVDTALLTLAMCGGNAAEAQRVLASKEIKVNTATLSEWRKTRYPNRYLDLCERHRASIEGAVTAKVRELVLRSAEVAYEALELEHKRIAAGEIHDASQTLRNLATTIGIGVDKVLLYEGRPTQITETRSTDDVIRGLQAAGYVDSTADEEEAA